MNEALASASVFAFLKIMDKNGNKTQMQRMDFNPIFYVNVRVSIETMIKFDANGNVDVDAESKRTLNVSVCVRVSDFFPQSNCHSQTVAACRNYINLK